MTLRLKAGIDEWICAIANLAGLLLLLSGMLMGQAAQSAPPEVERLARIENAIKDQQHANDLTAKLIDDLLWYQRLGDIATVQKFRYGGPPLFQPNPTAQDAGTPLVVYAYSFVPKNLDANQKYPLLVFVHGGAHANFRSDDYATVVHELVAQGYVVVAPDYRGSTGYGADYYNQIDYGGKEIEDVFLAGRWMIARYKFIDAQRVGVLGFSHGGFITLWNVFNHPDAYKVAFAGVPVSNLAMRAGTKVQDAHGFPRDDYGAPSSIGKSAYDDVKEYVRRSPAFNADKLQTPLLIHTATNDSDVNVFEVQQLIDALKARGKTFEYKIYNSPPGDHYFEQLDTDIAREAREETYRFLARYLNPSNQKQQGK